MNKRAAVVGAGVIGSLMAWRLSKSGWSVDLFDQDEQPTRNCSFAAAGLLDSVGALEDAEPLINELAGASLEMWASIVKALPEPVFFQRRGTLALVHSNDMEQLDQWEHRIRRLNPTAAMERLRGDALFAIEPEIDRRFQEGLYFPLEGNIDNRALLRALHRQLRHLVAGMHFGTHVENLSIGTVQTATATRTYDQVIDCRGVRASAPGIRGVRGELFVVRAPDVAISRPVRLLHPKQPVYVVPRSKDTYVVGATQIECEDYSPVTVRSTLELLSAAYVIHGGFGEAEVLESVTQCRPAFNDNQPRTFFRDGVLHVNGLFRHGFLVSPKLTELACELLEHGTLAPQYKPLETEATRCA
ncbi:MAG: FAD-dependent oxidoreductase [Bdellovibrionales bacterium]|nr:FAD-dependent oxidoreductase [Bdellovibrionales bacterium]